MRGIFTGWDLRSISHVMLVSTSVCDNFTLNTNSCSLCTTRTVTIDGQVYSADVSDRALIITVIRT